MTRYGYLAWVLLLATACPALGQPVCRRSGFIEEYKLARVAVLLQEVNPPVKRVQKLDGEDREITTERFRIVAVFKAGNPPVKIGDELDLFAPHPRKGDAKLWYTAAPFPFPIPLTEESLAFVERLTKLPETGEERLALFLECASSNDHEIANECLAQLVSATREELRPFKSRFKHSQLVGWTKDERNANRRRHAYKLLAVCGSAEDVPLLEKQIMADGTASDLVLDDLLATYLALRGPDGLDLIDRQFLFKNAKPTQLFSILQALRASEGTLPRERLIKSLRLFLAPRHQYPDLVIHDLKRLEDWESMDRIAQIFKETKEPELVHRPVFLYLLACPKPEAKVHLEELKKLDPDGYRFAERIHKLPPPKPAEPAPEK